MRKIVKNGRVFVEDNYVISLEGTYNEIIAQLESWSKEFNIPLHDIEYSSYGEYSTVSYWRDMTDAELKKEAEKKAKTAARSKKLKETKEAKERAELLRLQKKYGTITE
jgi:hypothetical protein